MAKNKAIETAPEEEFEFTEMFDDAEDEAAAQDIFNGMVDSSKHQMEIALGLTQLIVESAADHMSEDAILNAFKKSLAVVAEHSPMQQFCENMGQANADA